jgi:hypothetical protein
MEKKSLSYIARAGLKIFLLAIIKKVLVLRNAHICMVYEEFQQ